MEETNNTIISYDSYRRPVTFIILIPVAIPSILCSLLILGYFFSHWHVMITKALRHHAVFLLSIISFLYTSFDLPFSMNYFRLGQHPYRTIPFCLWWYWFDYTLLITSLFLTATASIQRHVLVFHSPWLHGRQRRLLLHYIPLIISVVYPPLFYVVFIFLYPCKVDFDVTTGWCAYPCYIDDPVLYNIDWLLNTILPVSLIVLANLALIIRVGHSMKRIRQQQTRVWQRQKKLTLQLLAFSSLYVVVWLPTTTFAILRALAFSNLYADTPNLYYINHLVYFVCPLQSFLCILALPELLNFVKRRVKRQLVRSLVVPTVPN